MSKDNMNICGIQANGEYTIELKSARTGEIQKVIEQSNVITEGARWANWCRQMGGGSSAEVNGGSGVGSTQRTIPNAEDIRCTVYNANCELFNTLYLTDNTEPVDAMTPTVKGAVIGFGTDETVSADQKKGHFQRNLSFYTPEK